MSKTILQVAIPSPLRKTFDYLPLNQSNLNDLKPGVRLEVSFGKQKKTIGFLIAVTHESSLPLNKLKKIISVIDHEPLLTKKQLSFIHWASHYYQHPIGDVIFSALPNLLKQGKKLSYPEETFYEVNQKTLKETKIKSETKQKKLLDIFLSQESSVTFNIVKEWDEYSPYVLKALIEKSVIQKKSKQLKPKNNFLSQDVSIEKPTPEQQTAIDNVLNNINSFHSYLLNGITGSGKTLVYLHLCNAVITKNKQALILLPEITLTPQFIQRFESALNISICVYHSGLTDQERLNTWMQCRDGTASIVIGTRSAVWLPLKSPGLIVIDEEHDLSYKQQEGFRYSARDVAVYRANQENIPIILGSATPSMESLNNVTKSSYQELRLNQRIGSAVLPTFNIVDLKNSKMHGALSETLIQKIRSTIQTNLQVLLFINQRGFAPAVLCHHCGSVKLCQRCERPMIYHKQRHLFWCHHCDKQQPDTTSCSDCGHLSWVEMGHGTERIENDIAELFPDANIVRIDRDTTRKKGSLQQYLKQIQNSDANILIGTQMLAKGHDFPKLSLVGIVDMDSGLYSTDFRASERMAQLMTQVSGRAGRANSPGEVILQTHHPDHPLLNCLINQGYNAFSKLVLNERKEANFPPFSYHALLRAEAVDQRTLLDFLTAAKKTCLNLNHSVSLFGPFPSAMPKKAGKHRMHLLLESSSRSALAKTLTPWLDSIETLKLSRKVRWNLDVDPQDMI